MVTLSQAQSVFDYCVQAFCQSFDQSPQSAANHAAKVAAVAMTVANSEAKMAAKTKQAVLTAGIEATVFNSHLSGHAFRVAFDKQFLSSLKQSLEQLFKVECLQVQDNQLFLLGKGYYCIGQYDDAITCLTISMELEPTCQANSSYYLAKSYLSTKVFVSAEILFLKLIGAEIEAGLLSDYHDSLGLCYFQQGRIDEAVVHYLQALQYNLENRSAQHNLAVIYLHLATSLKNRGETYDSYYAESLQLLNSILERQPHDAHALFSMGGLHELKDDYTHAIDYYLRSRANCHLQDKETLCDISSNLAECYAQSGHNFYRSRNYTQASIEYEKALSEDPMHSQASHQLGMCAFKLGDYHRARQQFNILINFPVASHANQDELDENKTVRADAWISRAVCLRKLMRFDLAKGALVMAKDLEPDDEALAGEQKEIAASLVQQKVRFFQHAKLKVEENDATVCLSGDVVKGSCLHE